MTSASADPTASLQVPRDTILQRLTQNPLPAILILALLLCLPGITRSLWLDEGASIQLAHHLTPWDAQRPIYYRLLRVWLLAGDGEAWIRVPSILCGLGTIALVWKLARRYLDTYVATSAALLMALSAAQIGHSQEARMYTLAPLLLVASIGCLLAWADRRELKLLAAFTALAALSVLTMPFAALGVAFAIAIALFDLRRDRRACCSLFASGAAVALIWFPFFLRGVGHTDEVSWIGPTSPAAPLTMHAWALLRFDPLDAAGPWWLAVPAFRGVEAAVIGLAALGAVSSPQGRRLAVWFYGVVLVLLVATFSLRPIWVPRYLMLFFPALFVLVALGLSRLRSISPRASTALLCTLLCVELATRRDDARARYLEDWRQAAAWVTAHPRAGRVFVNGAWEGGVWEHYFPGPTTYVQDFSSLPHTGWLVVRAIASKLKHGGREQLAARLEARGARRLELPGIDLYELP